MRLDNGGRLTPMASERTKKAYENDTVGRQMNEMRLRVLVGMDGSESP